MSQAEKVVRYVAKHGSINAIEAVRELGITRISAVIYQLKDTQHAMKAVPSKTAKGFVDYVPDFARRCKVLKDKLSQSLQADMSSGQLRTLLQAAAYRAACLDESVAGQTNCI